MTFEQVRVEERERPPAHVSRSRLRRPLSLGVVVPAAMVALALSSCKKSETTPPSDETPADTTTTSQGDPSEPIQGPDEMPGGANPEQTASSPQTGSDMEALATSSGTSGAPSVAPPEPGPGAATTAGAKPASPAEPAEPSAAAAPAPERSAPSDTPPTGGQPAGGTGQAPRASLNATPEVYEGWKHFSANCERCHGQDALGSALAPDLRKSINEGSVLGTGPLTHDVYIGTLVAGRPAKGMPAFVELLDRGKMENIWAYLNARASGQLAPGRPIKQGG